nr:unnamed protein product [Digitaria exilis]
MGRRRLSPEAAGAIIPEASSPETDELRWPFGRLDVGLSQDELRESAYEIFFSACRCSSTATTRPSGAAGGAAAKTTTTNMAVTSRVKRALGLRARRTRAMVGAGGRPLTSAEMMRRQMGVTEQTDDRLRKTLGRCLVGPHRKVESLVLPLELLRHLKASDFANAGDHRAWQLRQLRILEASAAACTPIRDTVRSAALHHQMTTTATVRAAAATVLSCRRSVDRWADGYPLNVHLYMCLLRAVFDARDQTAVLDEVDELLDLITKTWGVLGFNRMAHDVCFAWLLLDRYVTTGQVEPELLCAVLRMLQQLSSSNADDNNLLREPWHLRMSAATLASMHSWAEGKLLDYHEAFGDQQGSSNSLEDLVSLAVLSATMRLSSAAGSSSPSSSVAAAGEQVERYIKSSVRRAFTRLHEGAGKTMDSMIVEVDEDPCETLTYVAAQTKELARVEREVYSGVLRRWHPCPTAVAAAALHGCFGALVKRYVVVVSSSSSSSRMSSESVRALHAASKLDKWLHQMAAEDEPAGSGRQQHIYRQLVTESMAPLLDVDATISGLVKGWMDERLTMGAECVRRARDSETWNPRSKAEPYAQSAVDLMKLAKVTVDELLEILQLQVPSCSCREELLQRLVDGIDKLVHQYALFVASTGLSSKESYVPPLPPLTRCNQDSKLVQLWRCQVDGGFNCGGGVVATTSSRPRGDKPQQATSLGTQRLYVRLNTLHYLLAVLHSIDRAIIMASSPQQRQQHRRARSSTSVFDQRRARPALDAACLHVSELSAYRLVFLDSGHVLHQALYQGGVHVQPIRPALRVLKQSLAFLASVLSERAQPLAARQVMKASVEAFLTVLLAGGSGRAFSPADHGAVAEDFASLKRLFCSFGLPEEAVDTEAAQAEGVLALMALSTDKLIHELLAHYDPSPAPHDLAVPPTTRRWSRSDANTLLRVLCYRDDDAASRFLKKAFHLPKR